MPKKIIDKNKPWLPKKMISKRDIVEKVLVLTYPRLMEGKMVQPMSLIDACKQVWISYPTLCNYRKSDDVIAKAWDDTIEQRRDIMHWYAENAIDDALTWKTKWIRPAEKVNIAFRLLEKTNKAYQPKQQLEVKSMNMDFSMSMEELQRKIQELSVGL